MTDRYHSRSITSPANRWIGFNRGGYNSPRADMIIERYLVSIDRRERVEVQRELLQELLGEVALMPLIWEVEAVATLRGTSGPASNGSVSTWNLYRWDRSQS